MVERTEIETLLGKLDSEEWQVDDVLVSKDFPQGVRPIRDKHDGLVALFPYHGTKKGAARMLFIQSAPTIVRQLLDELRERDGEQSDEELRATIAW